jgi:hypothetical protein
MIKNVLYGAQTRRDELLGTLRTDAFQVLNRRCERPQLFSHTLGAVQISRMT